VLTGDGEDHRVFQPGDASYNTISNVSTGDFKADTAGDSTINATLSLPRPCIAPIVFVTGLASPLPVAEAHRRIVMMATERPLLAGELIVVQPSFTWPADADLTRRRFQNLRSG
jgi:hypothetical protein